MQYRELHSWHVSATEAQRIQQRLRRHIQVGTYVRDIRYIAGADIAVAYTTPTVYAGVVVLDYTILAIVERKGIVSTTDFPYIPGLLSFREAPALLQVFAQLDSTPDIVVFDGQGMAHPRGLGIPICGRPHYTRWYTLAVVGPYYTTLAVVERKGIVSTTDFPYIPGRCYPSVKPQPCCRSVPSSIVLQTSSFLMARVLHIHAAWGLPVIWVCSSMSRP